MKIFSLLLLIFSLTAHAGDPWLFGAGEAINLTNGTAFKNGVKNISGSLNPSSTAVNAPSGSMYYSTSGTIYVKQDAGLTTNWLPLGIATTGSLTTLNGQSGPNVNIASGSSGTDFNITAGSNTITLNLPSSSGTNRGLLGPVDWATFNNKEPAISAGTTSQYWRGDKSWQTLDKSAVGLSNVDNTSDANKPISTATQSALNLKEDSIAAGTTSQYWRGDKSWQTLDKTAVGLANVDNTSDANKPISTATQTALNAKVDGAASSVDSEIMLYSGTTGKVSKRATGTGYAKVTSGVLSTTTTVPTSDLTGIVPLANGGTNKNMTAVNGGVVYTDADSQEVSAAGTSGQILKSNGAAAPTWINKSISGKAENLTAVTAETIVVPNNQLANVGNNNEQLIETGNTNLLRNAGLEAFDGPWWTTTGTFIIGNNPLFGKAEGIVSLTSAALSISQDSTLNAAQFTNGVQGLASVWVKTTITSTPIYVCPRKAGSTVTVNSTNCAVVQTTGAWALYKVPFILGATSNGIDITSNGVSIASGTVSFDEGFVGAVDLKADLPVQQTQSVFGNVSASTVTSLSGTTSGSGLFTTSGGTLTALAKIQVVATMHSTIVSTATGNFVQSSIGTNAQTIVSSSSGQTINAMAATTRVLNAGDTLVFAITGTPSPSNYTFTIVATSVTNTGVYTNTCGANCVDTFSAKISSSGVVSAENADWINGNATVSAVSLYTLTFNPNIFTVAPNCVALPFSGSNYSHIQEITAVTNTGGAWKTYINTSTDTATEWRLVCQKQGVDFTATRTIIGLFKEIPTTKGSDGADFQSVRFGSAADCGTSCTVSPCTICNRVGNKITSITRVSTGIYQAVGIDNTKYACTGSGTTAGGAAMPIVHDNSTSTGNLYTRSGTTATDINTATLICVGIP